MVCPRNLAEASNEVRVWLEHSGLEKHALFLVRECGYDDLEAISRCNDAELRDLLECLKPDNAARSKLKNAVSNLREEGIESVRQPEQEEDDDECKIDLEAVMKVTNEGYLSINLGDDWVDKWMIIDGGILVWKKGKKAANAEGQFDFSVGDIKAKRVERNRVYLFQQQTGEILIEFESPEEIPEWFPGL